MQPAELRRIRRRLDLSQQQLARKLDLHRNSIVLYETGKLKIPRVVQIAARCIAYHEAGR